MLLKEFIENFQFEKSQQTTKEKSWKLPNMVTVKSESSKAKCYYKA